eukprot:412550-Amorphochlora_amoeboformis.AAC.1
MMHPCPLVFGLCVLSKESAVSVELGSCWLNRESPSYYYNRWIDGQLSDSEFLRKLSDENLSDKQSDALTFTQSLVDLTYHTSDLIASWTYAEAGEDAGPQSGKAWDVDEKGDDLGDHGREGSPEEGGEENTPESEPGGDGQGSPGGGQGGTPGGEHTSGMVGGSLMEKIGRAAKHATRLASKAVGFSAQGLNWILESIFWVFASWLVRQGVEKGVRHCA